MTTTVMDIETGPLPDAELLAFKPQFTAPKNYKDPARIAEYLAGKEEEWREKAALSPVTGRVLAVGFAEGDKCDIVGINDETERLILERTFKRISWVILSNDKLITHNGIGFDFPFLIRRSWKLGVTIPQAFSANELRRIPQIQDTMLLWGCGNYQDRISLDQLGRHFGYEPKDHSGADFARLWADNRDEAIAYLEYDLWLTRECWLKMSGEK